MNHFCKICVNDSLKLYMNCGSLWQAMRGHSLVPWGGVTWPSNLVSPTTNPSMFFTTLLAPWCTETCSPLFPHTWQLIALIHSQSTQKFLPDSPQCHGPQGWTRTSQFQSNPVVTLPQQLSLSTLGCFENEATAQTIIIWGPGVVILQLCEPIS